MEYVIEFFWITLVEATGYAGILCEFNSTFGASLAGYLHFLANEALDLLYFFELHALGLAALLELEELVMTKLARVEYFTARCLHMTLFNVCIHFL